MAHDPDDAAACIEGHGDDPIGDAPSPAYLLSAVRTDPGARGYHDHLGVWATLEDAQAYSDKLGGVGEWETTQHDSVEYWARDTTTPAISHLIEGIAHIAGGEPATTATIETDAAR